jgi:SPP1 family phage portal protein
LELLKTEKETLSTAEIEGFIHGHRDEVDRLSNLWAYYCARNTKILERPRPDPNSPDNRSVLAYGRKIVTTFVGYAYRPGFVSFKADDQKSEAYVKQLQDTFDLNGEANKTSRHGRNTAIYGYSYEMLYIDRGDALMVTAGNAAPAFTDKAVPRFFVADPREVILLYDYSPEPRKQMGIRYYRITDQHYKVELYTKAAITVWDRRREHAGAQWIYTEISSNPNFFGDIPIVAYYMGDDRLGIIEPVLSLIDDYDLLISDSFNEFDRFANAYLLLKKMSLVPPDKMREPGGISRVLRDLKRRRVFENLPDISEPVKFLTKDVPTAFIEFMCKKVKDEIHTQSHVPDFKDMATGTLSGAAIKRLLFDFENVVSSAEADFDDGLQERIRLMNIVYGLAGLKTDDTRAVVITHKRNLPDDLKEHAETAGLLTNAGFSKRLVAESMPDSVVPDVDAELAEQKQEREESMADVDRQMTDDEDNMDDEAES